MWTNRTKEDNITTQGGPGNSLKIGKASDVVANVCNPRTEVVKRITTISGLAGVHSGSQAILNENENFP